MTTSILPRLCRDSKPGRTRFPRNHASTTTTLTTRKRTATTTNLPRAIFTNHIQYSYDHSHDEQYQAWLNDLVTVVESNTWSAVPALLRFPRAEPEIVLAFAASSGQAKLVETILRTCDDCVDLRSEGSPAAGAAVAAASRGHSRVLSTLLDAGLSADAVDEHDTSLLLAAVGAADVLPVESARCVATLLEAGADANASMSRKGWKPIMAAAKSGDPDVMVMRMLLDAGADHEARYPNGKTPLYCAAEWGRLGAVRVLLDAGARPEVPADRLMTDWSRTEADMRRGVLPAEVAARNGHMAVARMLSEATAATAKAREAEGVAVRFASCQLPASEASSRRDNVAFLSTATATGKEVAVVGVPPEGGEEVEAGPPPRSADTGTNFEGEDSW